MKASISTRFEYLTLENCAAASGTVVVTDVLRAFSTAAYAFAAGAAEILLVSDVEQALELRRRFPGARTMGEVNGLPIPGFDFGNSPSELAGRDLSGLRLIQRTSAGTQGVVRSQGADSLLATSLVCALATACWIAARRPQAEAFIITGARPAGALPGWPATRGDEDLACADYLRQLLDSVEADSTRAVRRVSQSPNWKVFADPQRPEFPAGYLAVRLVSMGAILLLPGTPVVIWGGTFGAGFIMASIFPTMITLAQRRLTITGDITGWFFIGAGLGGVGLPWLIGRGIQPVGPQVMPPAILIDLGLAAVVLAVILLASGRRPAVTGAQL